MIKTSVILFILLYLTSAYSAQTVDKLNSNQLKLPQESISRALILDATGQIKSSSTVSDTELSYLDGLTDTLSNLLSGKESTITSGTVSQYYRGDKTFQTLDKSAVGLGSVDNTSDANKPVSTAQQTALNLKLSTTGDESASGIKTFTGQTVASSTTIGFIPCPAMTDAQMNAIASPQNGSCVYNTTNAAQYVYSTTSSTWKVNGGGGTGGISAWVTAKSYIIDDVVIESNKIYKCLIAHTSGTFSTDLAAVKWQIVSGTTVEIGSVLPLANGGTNKIATASDGAIAYSDTDSFELLAPGTSGQILQTNGAAAPSFVNKSISAKAQNASSVTAEEIQVPNNLLTETATNKHLNETGNTNILSNPSFEHSTFSTSWTNSAGTFTQETSVVIDGKASAKLVLAAQTMSLTQSSTLYAAQFADGVQGLAMVRIKSDIALKVCSIQAGTVSTTNCVTTATDSKWGLYKIPFVMGATSQGVSIASTGSVTGTVYVDDAFVGAVDLKQDISSFATILNAEGNGGTSVTANVTNITFNEITDTTNSWNGTTFTIPETGTYAITAGVQFTVSASKYIAIYINGTVYRTLSDVSVLTTPFNKGDYVGKFTKGDIISIRSSGTGTLTNVVDHFLTISQSTASSVYSASCGANCVDTFSARFDAAGSLLSENIDWINGNSVLSDTSLYTITVNSGVFVASNQACTVSNISTSGTTTDTVKFNNTPNATTIVVRTQQHTASTFSKVAQPFQIICQKQGADFVATRTIQGSFNEVVTSPGISKPKVCHYAFGQTGSTLTAPIVLSSGSGLEIYDTCGTGSAPTFSATGTYLNMTFASGTWANSSAVSCVCNPFASSTSIVVECTPYWETGDQNITASSSGGYVMNLYTTQPLSTTNPAINSYVIISCFGSAP